VIFKEFGTKSKPVLILLHGGGLSWWSFTPHIEALKDDYFIIAPIIDGHGEDWNNTFLSIEHSAEQIIKYINENYNGRVHSICGLSIGAQILVEILAKEPDITKYAVIESALLFPLKSISLFVPTYNILYGLSKKKWFAKIQAKNLNIPDELFEHYYNDSCLMTKESFINLVKSNGNYLVPSSICNTNANVLILVGEYELPVMKKSAKLLRTSIAKSKLKILERSKHGEFCIIYPDKYVELLKELYSK